MLQTPRSAPGLDDILAARDRIAPHIVTTPLLESPALNEAAGFRLLLKAESLQVTGSFKVRGAFNRLLQLDADARRRGVVAFSSGNHAQAVAAAAQALQMPALIFMPADAPAMKIAKTRRFGAEVYLYDRRRDDREALSNGAAKERNAVLVPPFEDPDIIAGQGTVALEVFEQARDTAIDAFLVPCSGGGLAAGCAIVASELAPGTMVHVVEPAGFDDFSRSLQSGNLEQNAPGGNSICDSLLANRPGRLNLDLLRGAGAGALTVTDDEVRAAMVAAFADAKLVLEPGGAAGLAAALQNRERFAGRTVVVVCSGANVDPAVFAEALAEPQGA